MKKNKCIAKIFSLVFLVVFTTTNIHAQTENDVKIISYNIWNGFDWGKDLERKKELVAWINTQKPDVLALQELCAYTPELLKEDAKKWGHEYSVLLKTEGYSVGLTSNKPIELIEKVRKGMWHGMLHCTTYGIDFFVLHLSPADYESRKREAFIIRNKVQKITNNKYVLLGDFNAHSPFDRTTLEKNKKLLEKYRKNDTRKDNKYKNLLNHTYDYSVVSSFLGLPTIDVSFNMVLPNKRYSFPTPALIKGYNRTAQEILDFRERIDYILLSPVLAKDCLDAQIHNDQNTNYLSDHYPVSVTLSLK